MSLVLLYTCMCLIWDTYIHVYYTGYTCTHNYVAGLTCCKYDYSSSKWVNKTKCLWKSLVMFYWCKIKLRGVPMWHSIGIHCSSLQ